MIKVKKRARVSEAFLASSQKLSIEYLKRVATATQGYSDAAKKRLITTAANVLPIAQGDFDVYKTRLRSLEYMEYDIIQSGDTCYFAGLTKPIVFSAMRYGAKQVWNLGRYMVLIPYHAMLYARPAEVHMVPEQSKAGMHRHPHHMARDISDAKGNFLNYDPVTCFGGLGALITSAMNSGDIAGTFRAFHIFLSRWNPNSELTSAWRDFATRVRR